MRAGPRWVQEFQRRASAALVVTLLAGCASAPAGPGGVATPKLALEKCGIADIMEPVLCGDLPVPENRAVSGGRTISLNIVVIPALGEKTLPPLYHLEGGPGLAASAAAAFWAGDGSVHRAHRDIVLMDARGTGGSNPLMCKLWVSNPYRPVLDDQDTGTCRDQYLESTDLTQYGTEAVVADLDAVRVALGHDRIDLSALSYGTRVAQEYLRAHPQNVRAMVLAGTLSPAEKLPLSFGRNANDVLNKLAAACSADAACKKAVPDLAADVAKIAKKFEPGTIKVKHKSGRVTELIAGPFWEAVRAKLISVRTQRELPWLLHEAAADRWAPLVEYLAPKPERAAFGALLSTSCPEDTLDISDSEIAGAGGGVFGTYRIDQQRRACRIWGVPAAPRARTFVSEPTPVLLLAGELDAVTPPSQATEVASKLINARVVVVPNLGHAPDGLTNMPCYDQLIAAFFEAATAADLDTGCLATMQPPAFLAPEPVKKKPAKKN